jgi:hypothetical protein
VAGQCVLVTLPYLAALLSSTRVRQRDALLTLAVLLSVVPTPAPWQAAARTLAIVRHAGLLIPARVRVSWTFVVLTWASQRRARVRRAVLRSAS